jgi:nucleoid-associated protein YgaU
VLLLLAAVISWHDFGGGHEVVAPPEAPPVPAPQAAKAPAAAPSAAPSFDAIHVGPDGSTVIAGRAAPGAEVTILDHGQPIGRATADANGEWVVLPDRPLPSGPRELSATSRVPGGQEERSAASVAVLVPERPQGIPPVAVLLPQGEGAARALQLPGGRSPHDVSLGMVEYEASGRVILSGAADPGARIEIAIGDRHIATVTADAQGSWTAQLTDGVPVGRYRLRLVGRDADGAPAGDITVALRRAAPGELAAGDYLAVVPGNSLWHLAQRSYGDGLRYIELYRANHELIGNPDLIYPGQLLALPGKS